MLLASSLFCPILVEHHFLHSEPPKCISCTHLIAMYLHSCLVGYPDSYQSPSSFRSRHHVHPLSLGSIAPLFI
eukprot:29440_3